MTAFFVAQVDVKNPEKFQEYGLKAGETIKTHGGSVLVRGKLARMLTEGNGAKATAVIQFPDLDAVDAWFGSDAYQALIPLRQEAADMQIAVYEVPAA